MNDAAHRARLIAAGAAVALCAAAVSAQQTDTVKRTVSEQVRAGQSAAASQDRIEKLDDETQRLLADFRATVRETESLRRYNEQLERQIKSQEEEVVSMLQQIDEIERTNREIYPLMQRMIETLENFVKLDLPFLMKERGERVATLKQIMNRADVSTAEKYRRLLEAYGVEMEYGRTIEAYQGKLGDGEDARTVDFLRVGRVALMYQTLDGDDTGYWDHDAKAWREDNDYEDAVRDGLRLARKQAAPQLLTVPVKAPEEVK